MIIKNVTKKKLLANKAFHGEFYGLMFKKINNEQACVLINELNDKTGSGIHMWFVPQELDIIWLNDNKIVVDVKHCKRWRLYWPKKPAKYIIELLDAKGTIIGDKISF